MKEEKMRIQKLATITVLATFLLTISFISMDSIDFQSPQLIAKGGFAPPYHTKKMREKCHGLSKDQYEFGNLLTESNQKMFCSKFTDDQRKKAMEIANQKSWSGNPIMTPDQAVEEVAKESNNRITKLKISKSLSIVPPNKNFERKK